MGIIDEVFARGFMVSAGNFYLNGRPQTRVEFHETRRFHVFSIRWWNNMDEGAYSWRAMRRTSRALPVDKAWTPAFKTLSIWRGKFSSRYARRPPTLCWQVTPPSVLRLGGRWLLHHLLLFTVDEPNIAALPEVQTFAPKDIVCPWLITPRPREWSGQLLVDRDRSIHRKFGATSSCAYLIRPDRYIGYRASPVSPGRISAYLTTVFM